MDACKVDGAASGASFDELVDEMQGDLYWVRFFARGADGRIGFARCVACVLWVEATYASTSSMVKRSLRPTRYEASSPFLAS